MCFIHVRTHLLDYTVEAAAGFRRGSGPAHKARTIFPFRGCVSETKQAWIRQKLDRFLTVFSFHTHTLLRN